MSKVLYPQEIEVWYIIPAIRRELVKALKKLKLKQKEIARCLGITEAAVSQYLSSKRASEVKFSDSTSDMIHNSAKLLKDSKMSILDCTQAILNKMRSERATCKVHKKLCNMLGECEACLK